MRRLLLISSSLLCLACPAPKQKTTPKPTTTQPTSTVTTPPRIDFAALQQQETKQLVEKLNAQKNGVAALEKTLEAYLNQPLKNLSPQKAADLAKAFNPKDFFPEDGLFLPTTPLLDRGKKDTDPRYLSSLLEYQEGLALFWLYLQLYESEAAQNEEKLTSGFEKILARAVELRGTEPSLQEAVGAAGVLTSAPWQGFGLELQEKSNKGRLVLIKEVTKVPDPTTGKDEISSYQTYDAKLGAAPTNPKDLKNLTKTRLALIDRRNIRTFLLNRDTTSAEGYLLRVYSIANALKNMEGSYTSTLSELEAATKAPITSALVFASDYNQGRQDLLSVLKASFDEVRAPMEKLIPVVLSLKETEASLPPELGPLLQTVNLLSREALQQYPSTFLRAQTLALLFQYRFLTDTFYKALQDHKKKLENSKEALQQAIDGKLPKPKYVVVLLDQTDSGGIISGSVCLSLKEPKIESREDMIEGKKVTLTIKTYILKSDPHGQPFERESTVQKDKTEAVREISNPEIIPDYAAQLVSDYRSRVENLQLIARQLQRVQEELAPLLEADIKRQVRLGL